MASDFNKGLEKFIVEQRLTKQASDLLVRTLNNADPVKFSTGFNAWLNKQAAGPTTMPADEGDTNPDPTTEGEASAPTTAPTTGPATRPAPTTGPATQPAAPQHDAVGSDLYDEAAGFPDPDTATQMIGRGEQGNIKGLTGAPPLSMARGGGNMHHSNPSDMSMSPGMGAAIGGGLGGIGGALMGSMRDDEERKKHPWMPTLIGGGLGAGAGALMAAYNGGAFNGSTSAPVSPGAHSGAMSPGAKVATGSYKPRAWAARSALDAMFKQASPRKGK